MGVLKFTLSISLFVILGSCNFDEVQYYVNLINREQQRAEYFNLPVDAQLSKPHTRRYLEYGMFDHIVIGAGTAGSIVASRLSEDKSRNVLLLEAGGYETNFTDIPFMAGTMQNSEYNWNYRTVPQSTSCLGMNKRQCSYSRGKIVGGSSGINGLLYTRGNKRDFDNWCLLGNPGWCYKDILTFFKKSENSKINGDPFYHGFGGPLNVEYTKPRTKKHVAFIAANIELGSSFVDYNGKRQEGVGFTQYTTKNGKRGSSGRMFLHPVLNRKNLKIEPYSHVTQILINPKSKKAFGVVYAKNNQYYIAQSRKDIVLSAGAIGSPQLLMLSGIGPISHLEELKIPVIQNLSVGQNLQDHVGLRIMLNFITNYTDVDKSLEDNLKDYLNGTGLFTDPFDSKSIAFLRSNFSKVDNFPDIELLYMSSHTTYPIYKTFFNLDFNTYKDSMTNFDYRKSFAIIVFHLHPDSKGYIKLKSADPFEYPLINPKMLSDTNFRDIGSMYEGVKLALKLLDTNAFKQLSARLHHVHLPACKRFTYLSKRYWYCHIRQLATSFAHPVGTCKMGPDPLKGDVVDHTLKVYGIQNLRVADASIMPVITSGHTSAPVMMIGEKAAHMIMFE
ncbi:hypothetical protein FQR65_LT08170 [Abscondita terminalis]|nr:hypothetical protein FQR65_LT08170 [Abscondita terminalis]